MDADYPQKLKSQILDCLKRFVWHPIAGVNGLFGRGDSGKSTILDAIDYEYRANATIGITRQESAPWVFATGKLVDELIATLELL